MSTTGPSLLLINPWVYDCAAYDFFAKPLGLLYLAGLLMAAGYEVRLVDCLGGPHVRPGPFGTGRYAKEILPTPPPLQNIPRRYGRYGLSEAAFKMHLANMPAPAAILVTSLMTYWYPGVVAVIRLVRRRFPEVPIILGGIYATLCPEHARRHCDPDLMITGPAEKVILAHLTGLGLNPSTASTPPNFNSYPPENHIFSSPLMGEGQGGDDKIIPPPPHPRPPGEGVSSDREQMLSCWLNNATLDPLPYPALHLLPHLSYIPILTSRGCPLDCSYCASHLLQPRYQRRRPLTVVEELTHWQDFLGLKEVAFYDDALLLEAESHLLIILEELARRGRRFRFHTPNGLHAHLITKAVADWLKQANFATLRLGVETTNLGAGRLDHKLQKGDLERGLANLHQAGFKKEDIGVYLLIGLPEQSEEEVANSLRQVKKLGATPILAQYSPIPGTALWLTAVKCSRYDLESDPLFHNNSLFPCWPKFSWTHYTQLKRLAGEG